MTLLVITLNLVAIIAVAGGWTLAVTALYKGLGGESRTAPQAVPAT